MLKQVKQMQMMIRPFVSRRTASVLCSSQKEGIMQRLTDNCSRITIGLLGGLLLLVAGSNVAYADHLSQAENVSATKHNLAINTNIGFSAVGGAPGSGEVCVYCHTPHGAGYGSQLNVGFPPLWNRAINSATAYTTYDAASSPHFEQTSANTLAGQIKGVSLACLSCHDGTIAFDALINLPGSGGYQVTNATALTSGTGQHNLADALFGSFGGQAVSADHTFNDAIRGNASSGLPFDGSRFDNDTLNSIGGGAAPFPNLTDDLRDDHPISFRIPYGADDPQFSQLESGSVADANGKLLYLKRVFGAGTGAGNTGIYPVDKRDRIRAYTSVGGSVATASVVNAYIECASCHNPHTPRTLFLRLPSNVNSAGAFASTGTGLLSGGDVLATGVANATYWSHAPNQGSAICISCHQK
jgi:hypothetical protein